MPRRSPRRTSRACEAERHCSRPTPSAPPPDRGRPRARLGRNPHGARQLRRKPDPEQPPTIQAVIRLVTIDAECACQVSLAKGEGRSDKRRWRVCPAQGEHHSGRRSATARRARVECFSSSCWPAKPPRPAQYGHSGSNCRAPGFLDSGLKVITSTLPRPARRNRGALGLDSDSRTSPASTARCTSVETRARRGGVPRSFRSSAPTRDSPLTCG